MVVVVVDVEVEVVVELNGAALVVVVVGPAIVVVVVDVGNAKVVVEVVVDVELVVVENKIICKFNSRICDAEIEPILNLTFKDPNPVVKKLVLARYRVPPGIVGVVSVYKGP